ncbi:MAG: terpene cyclase/mutase family protein [Planctomycetaceae bacterium]|nr:terpene cyclase/mutase family protein [Planctomycetaceae bacterium]
MLTPTRCVAKYLQTLWVLVVVLVNSGGSLSAQEGDADELSPNSVLTDAQWDQLESSVDSAIEFLATQQARDGSFKSHVVGQPAVTSLCVLAFLSRGHTPIDGPYAKQLSKAIDFIVSKQRADGLICSIDRNHPYYTVTGSYNHAINGLALCEVYGMSQGDQQKVVRKTIEMALEFSRKEQQKSKRWADDDGGWRYLNPAQAIDSDLSITSWHLMFYRSARNAEFDIPNENVDAAAAFVRRCYDEKRGSFCYGLRGYGRSSFSRSMAGAGALSLSLAGDHNTKMARRTGDFIVEHTFDDFNRGGLTREDRYYYGAFYCSQATYQIGADYFGRFYPNLLQTLVANQNKDGSWPLEANQTDRELGFTYSTSLAVLALTPPYQMIPIFQR